MSRIKKFNDFHLNENDGSEPYLPLDKDRFYLDIRKDKILRIISVDGDDVYVEYFDFKTRKPTGEKEHYKKNQVDYWIKMGAWREWKQKFR